MIETVDGLRFSSDALHNRALFLAQFNDVNIFVEDEGKEYIYEEIFDRLFGSEIEIFSIFPLGGKSAVIQEHQVRGILDSDGKVNIFIVDGDFDNLWEEQKIVSPNFIYLTRYNIESYFCSQNAVISFLRSTFKCTRKEVETKFNFNIWKSSMCKDLGQLFILFALVKRHYPTLPNVNLGSAKFLNKDGSILEKAYIDYLNEISSKIDGMDLLIQDVTNKVSIVFEGDEEDRFLSIICGKYQFDSLCRRLTTCWNKNINRESFSSALISKFDLKPLSFLREQILQLIADNLLEKHTP